MNKTTSDKAKINWRAFIRRQYMTLALASVALLSQPGEVAARDTFDVKETELRAFERHDEVVLTLTKPLYRLGEILQLDDGRWVVPMNYWFAKGQWHYLVTEVKVGKPKENK